MKQKDSLTLWLMLLPCVIVLGIIVIVPFFKLVETSLYSWKLSGPLPKVFLGWGNYLKGVLLSLGQVVPNTHNLEQLQKQFCRQFAKIAADFTGDLADAVRTNLDDSYKEYFRYPTGRDGQLCSSGHHVTIGRWLDQMQKSKADYAKAVDRILGHSFSDEKRS